MRERKEEGGAQQSPTGDLLELELLSGGRVEDGTRRNCP